MKPLAHFPWPIGRCSVILALFAGAAAGADGPMLPQRTLFNGQDLSGWQRPWGEWVIAGGVRTNASDMRKFETEPGIGVMVNGASGRTVNLLSVYEHGDVEAHLEFCVPRQSNSGIYFMGRYEVQVYDSYGVAKDKYPGIECGGIYPRWINNTEVEGHTPRLNASKPPGEWQSFEVVFRAPRFDGSGKKIAHAKFVKVVHNGQVIHENIEVTGPTRAARFEDEKPRGPLMLQGDHGPVAYRNLSLRAIELK